jgi:large exoprotein involved in heme utilization and adhesion
VIRGGRLLVDHGLLGADTLGNGRSAPLGIDIAVRGEIGVTNGSVITATTLGSGRGGTIRIAASDTVSLIGGSDPIIPGSGNRILSGIFTGARSDGDAGDIIIEAPRVSLTSGGFISANSLGPGRGGTIRITASDTASVSGAASVLIPSVNVIVPLASSAVQSLAFGTGDAGDIIIKAPRMSLTTGAAIDIGSAGPGQGGTVRITASEFVFLSGTTSNGQPSSINAANAFPSSLGVSNVGNVSIEAPRVSLTAGARISAETGGPGRGGDVVVQAGSFDLTGGAQISSNSGSVNGLRFLVGTGAGGTIRVMATEPISLDGRDSGLFARTVGVGRGGDITVHAPRVALTNGATISAESAGPGNAGNITITTQDSFLSTHGSVTTRATQADGGNIQITAVNFLRLRDSAITAEVGGRAQTVGGNITIDPQFIVLQNSQIRANAFEGQGGNIRLQVQQVFLADPASTVSASSTLGINGLVAIQSPVKSITGAVAPLPQAFARTTGLLRNRCAARAREGTVSRFILGGRDGVPLEPGSWLPSALESMDQQHSVQNAQTSQARHSDSEGSVRIDNTGQEQVQGQYAQIQWPDRLDVECARWLGQQRTRQQSTR